MKTTAHILPEAKTKRPFLQQGKKTSFLRPQPFLEPRKERSTAQELPANQFAQKAASHPEILHSFLASRLAFKPSAGKRDTSLFDHELKGNTLPQVFTDTLQKFFGENFSHIQIHADEFSTLLTTQHNAAAYTTGHHVFLNMNVFDPNTAEGLMLLSHELFHTIQSDEKKKSQFQLKPLTELNDQSPEQKAALLRAVKIAKGEEGKVNSKKLNEDKTRVGWEYLLEYFKTSFGEENIVKESATKKPGQFAEEYIKYIRLGKAQKVRVENGKKIIETKDNVDVLPSWCGIFAFWALNKAGIITPKWVLGETKISAKDYYKKNEYLPRPGDIVHGGAYAHYALVVKTDPEIVTDTKELKNVKVTTINGNTAGSNHQGGQIQLKTDDYSYWDLYINPFFSGVTLTPEKEYKPDERLKARLGEKSTESSTPSTVDTEALKVNTYDSSIQPVANFDTGLKKDGNAKEEKEEEKTEAPKVNAKTIMENDEPYQKLQKSIAKNAEAKRSHDPAEQKAGEAQRAAVSPANESMSRAKANKVQKMGSLPKPKQFNATDLKNNILKEVDKLLKEKEAEANDTGEKPKIKQDEINDVKTKNNQDIKSKKTESVGDIETAHKEQPDESSVEKRTNEEEIVEDAGKNKMMPETDRAVAKPVAEERITLENESAKLDNKMAENDIDEKQLEESEEEKFTSTLDEKRKSQQEASNVKKDYREIETEKLDKDKKNAKFTIDKNIDKVHSLREGEFGNVNTAKKTTKSTDELKRKEISDKIEGIYTATEKSVNDKLNALETTVNIEFDEIMKKANDNFKENVNDALDDEFVWEFAAKHLDRSDYNRRVRKVFVAESKKYTDELSLKLDPLTRKIADTLNATITEIEAGKKAVTDFVDGLEPNLKEIGIKSAALVSEKFTSLEESVTAKEAALTNSLAKKYADGVSALEEEFKKIMDSRKSWLEKAYDAIVSAIKEILNLLSDLKKALERAAEYGSRIIKAPIKFFKNLARGVKEGFENFVSNIGKHLLTGALEWITGELGDAGIQLPDKFDFKGILSLILQILGISFTNIKEIAKKVIGAKYVDMLEKGAELGVKAGDKILMIFNIVKKDGIAGLWEFIKEQFNDLKERLMEEAKGFIITTIIETAVVKIASMLIPGAGFISAIKSLIDFMRTLFAKARQIVNIITGIIDTFGEILSGNIAKVSSMVEKTLARFLSLAITFLAAILGLGKIGKKIGDIIQKKIKDPINKAITKIMEKLKMVMTKLGIFKFLDKVDEKIKKGKDWVEDKKEKIKDKAKEMLGKIKGFLKSLSNKYTDQDGETHTLRFKDTDLYRESVSKTLGNYLNEVTKEINKITNDAEKKKHLTSVNKAKTIHGKIVKLIGDTVRKSGTEFKGADKGFSPAEGEELRGHLAAIADLLRTMPLANKKNVIPKTKIAYKEGVNDGEEATASLISLDSDLSGSQPAGANSPLSQQVIDIVVKKQGTHNLVRGHLINHELFGTGEGTKNLAPIPKRANSRMLRDFEKEAKNLVHANNVVSLHVVMNYGEPNDKISGGKSIFKKNLPANAKLPVSVKYSLKQLGFTGASDAPKTEINEPTKWTPQGLDKGDTILINHDDFF